MTETDPHWYRDAVIYQVHVKSFFDSNDDGTGDIEGLIRKLDYIAGLGVTVVWMLPFYPSPRRDDGYDIADYRGIHPDYGTMRDFKRFVAEAHKRGLRVVTELVINHTSDQHEWFQRARLAKPGSWQRDFYVWRDDDKGFGETRVIFCDTEKSNWAWDDVAKAYYWHRFYSHQPDLNFDNPRVLRAILDVLHYWLKMGVDGLRLDAVPYLVEREGTNNENLPQTHDIIKKIRAELDAHYPDRMLLAEANQWPEDVKEYFGDGDECHMAFHFPLMPRMYMAIAQEDRYPITDILRQTPPIPDGCQWAIFLRNHDELTLEMVTDSERDYLWSTYAADRRARINLGIRRRLAPLLEHDRRRVELMNSLLLSMPGTPVIYYGDEIGMGDNIFLGDRDGVRTPMQWSNDRNGGFSRADFARLVLPPVMDPIYGFETVNVEAQLLDRYSLLNWTRRMVAVRQSHAATFGRGEYRFLYPGNRKILAYIREREGEAILCVANLSRSPQAVELDLSAWHGRIPIELMGRTPFPPIGDLTYLLTLPPFGFFWFVLAEEAALPGWHAQAPQPMPELVTFVMRDGLKTAFGDLDRKVFETQVLPAYLPLRRWYHGKGTRLSEARLVAAAVLNTSEGEMVLGEIETVSGSDDRYFLPFGVAFEDQDQRFSALTTQLALARARRGRRVGLVTDAFARDPFIRAMVSSLASGAVLPCAEGGGEIRFRPAARMADFVPDADAPIVRFVGEQSNSTVMVGDLMFKLVRRTFLGIHPEAEMGRYLTAPGGFEGTPAYLGDVVHVGADGQERLLAVAQSFVRNQGDAWAWTLGQLKRLLDDALVHDHSGDEAGTAPDAQHPLETLAPFLATLGRRLAEMHLALARESDDPAFAPEPLEVKDVEAWTANAAEEAAEALDLLAGRLGDLPAEAAAPAALLLDSREPLLAAIRAAGRPMAGGLKTRIHGDLHLGQVLVAAGDAVIVDFEGEPLRPLDERRAKSAPARDVAGMLRSLDYAADAAMRDLTPHPPGPPDPRPALVARWRGAAREVFLAAYEETIGEAPIWPKDARDRQALVDLFVAGKAAYELTYELTNRPAWVGIPIAALLALAGVSLPEAAKEAEDA
ncbi:trehalose synthase [Humitalea rosea]|uniref:Maltokinase n=1 Tax=Humitalea rosea TaxID=990373 RepID=A0A2W7JFG1_9PROT|nr:maltose alpha-D-glucosyltransferase [Humitalea rosea]PZW50518.1 trehalose synthase [Humitalea rosea]